MILYPIMNHGKSPINSKALHLRLEAIAEEAREAREFAQANHPEKPGARCYHVLPDIPMKHRGLIMKNWS